MKILSIDTSSSNCSVSITEVINNEFNIITTRNSNDEKTHSQKLMPIIDNIFNETSLTLDNIDLLVCCIGPGSFTGIRIGVATIKAFADVKGIPVIGVTSLESLAYNVISNGYILPIIDAKNSNVYTALFGNNYLSIIDGISGNINDLLDSFYDVIKTKSNQPIYFVGNGSILYKDLILDKFADFDVNFCDENIQSSISLAKCGYDKYKSGIHGDSNSLSPIYLRKSQAERNANGEK